MKHITDNFKGTKEVITTISDINHYNSPVLIKIEKSTKKIKHSKRRFTGLFLM